MAKKKTFLKFFPIVAIGTSAGGLEAIMELLQNLPANTGMVFIYIQHMDPGFPSQLASILSRANKMKVQAVINGLKVEPASKKYIKAG